MAVVAYAPSGVPRQAEGGQWFAAQKRLKTHLRGNAINFIDVLQQRNRIDVFCQKMDAVLLRQLGQIALFFAAQNIGMGFYPDIGLRVFIQGRLKHQFKRRGICTAILDGHIAEGLVDDEDGFRLGWGA